jgi:hypothetical protein
MLIQYPHHNLFLKMSPDIPIPLTFDHSSDFVEIEIDSKPVQSSTPFFITVEPCHEPVNSHNQASIFSN